LKVWYIGGKAYIDIDDAVEVVVGLAGASEVAEYAAAHYDWQAMIYKEARADLKHMQENDEHNFMGVLISAGNMLFGI